MLIRNNYLAIFCLFVFFITSCKKDDAGTSGPVKMPVGVPTEVGTSTGEPAVKKTIGAAGGTVSTTDNRIKVTIPAGAVATAQEFSIQPITNKNPLAIGNAFRIEPHDVQFSKPVSIEFAYEDEDVVNSMPEALGVAYQDDKGIWQAQGGVVLNKTQRTIKINTTHFSDWSLFESFYMISSATQLHVGSSAQLEVFTTEDLIVPLNEGSEVPMGKKVSMAAGYIKEWKLAGAGKLEAAGAKAVYKAPGTVPNAPNPVAISVSLDLKTQGKFLLVRHIQIVEDDGEIEVTVAGNGPVVKTASIAVMNNGYLHIADSDGDTQGSYVLIIVPRQLGTHGFRNPYSNVGPYFHYLVTGANNYVCQYIVDEQVVASGGGITITDLGNEDGFVKGTINVAPAGYGDMLTSTIGITGKFRVRVIQ